MLKRGCIGMLAVVVLMWMVTAAGAQAPADCAVELADVYLEQWKASNGPAIGDLDVMDAAHVVTQVYKSFRRLGSDVTCAEVPLGLTRTILRAMPSGLSGNDVAEIYLTVYENVSVSQIAEAPCAFALADTFLRHVDWAAADLETARIGVVGEKAFGVAQQLSGGGLCAAEPALLLTQVALDQADALEADPEVIRSVYRSIQDQLGSADA